MGDSNPAATFGYVTRELGKRGIAVTVQQLGSRLYRIASKGPL